MEQAYTLTNLPPLARRLCAAYPEASVWALQGELGAGKTTLIRALCAAWGVRAQVNSPTFTLVQTYDSPQGLIHHFDLYRLTSTEELLALDFEHYLDTGYRCLIEWPEIAADYLPNDTVLLKLYHSGVDSRRLETRLLNDDA